MIDDLCSPKASSAMRRAFSIVLIPIVMAPAGTFSIDPKKCVASFLERGSSRISRVWDDVCEPGSLNPMFPTPPMPST